MRAWWDTVNVSGVTRKNYCLDPSVENAASIGTIYTNQLTPAVVQSSTMSAVGTNSIRLGSDSLNAWYTRLIYKNASPGTAGDYMLSFYAALSPNHTQPTQIVSGQFKDAGGVVVYDFPSVFPVLGLAMNRYSYPVSVPTDFASFEISAVPTSEPSFNTEYTYYDGFMLEKSTVLGDYFDGSLPGCSWEGSPFTSPSLQAGSGSGEVDSNIYGMEDLWFKYLKAHSGLTGNFSLADHELAFYKSQLGL